jgi:hypothetical protein
MGPDGHGDDTMRHETIKGGEGAVMLRSVGTVYGYGPDGEALGCFSVIVTYPEGTALDDVEDRLEEMSEDSIEVRWVDGLGLDRESIRIETEVDHDGGE